MPPPPLLHKFFPMVAGDYNNRRIKQRMFFEIFQYSVELAVEMIAGIDVPVFYEMNVFFQVDSGIIEFVKIRDSNFVLRRKIIKSMRRFEKHKSHKRPRFVAPFIKIKKK